MSFEAALGSWRGAGPADISRFIKSLDPRWITEALSATGKATVRGRKLPADKVVWLVIGMCLFTDRSMRHVVEHLQLVLGNILAPSAITQARDRLTSGPMEWLFERICRAWSAFGETRWRGLSLYGLDGCHQRVADSDENFAYFGKQKCRGEAGYPQLRYVALMNLTTRLLAKVAAGPWGTGEVTLAEKLWAHVPDASLTIIDRGFLSFFTFFQLMTTGHNRHFLCRAKSNSKYNLVSVLSDGSALVELIASAEARRQHPEVCRKLRVRAVSYHHTGGKPGILFTSLLDPDAFPAAEILALYHKRWELEVAFDELKTHMLRRNEALRSRKPDGVYQEFWGTMLVYNLVRREIAMVADKFDVPPARISFTGALLLIQNFFLASPMAAPGRLPTHLAKLDDELRSSVLPARRSQRRYPRHVKIKMSNYKKNPGRGATAA